MHTVGGPGGLLIFVVFLLLSWIAQVRLRRKFRRYAAVGLSSGLSGKEAAERMLQDNGISDVRVTCVSGQLTDHYNPANKTVNLSEEVYAGRSVSSVAVAAHECGHAVQHARAYRALELRSAMVPIQNLSAKVMNMIFIMMFLGMWGLPGLVSFQTALLVVIGCYGIFTLFAFITLPVEFDASRRALLWMRERRIVSAQEEGMSRDALNAAAQTYVVAALSSLAMLLHYVLLFLGGSRD